ncbi:TPA: DUF4113 domain-containing protein [Enterobacter asburiae]
MVTVRFSRRSSSMVSTIARTIRSVSVAASCRCCDSRRFSSIRTSHMALLSAATRDIIAAATTALERIWKDGHRYAKAGVMLNDFTGSGVSQMQLFDERPPRPHSAELMKVLDGINHSGLGQVWFAGRGIAPAWQMKRDMLSPAYTTRWKDIPIARIG